MSGGQGGDCVSVVVGVKEIGEWGVSLYRSSLWRCVLYRSSLCTSHFIDLVCVDLD